MKRFIKDPDPKHPDRLLAIHDNGSPKGGYWAIDPQGHLVVLELTAKLKPKWRLATASDLEAKIAAEAEREPAKPVAVTTSKPTKAGKASKAESTEPPAGGGTPAAA